MPPRLPITTVIVASLGLGTACSRSIVTAPPDPEASGSPNAAVTLKKNGGWSWFMDARSVVDQGQILVGSTPGRAGDGSDRGDIEVTAYALASGEAARYELHDQLDPDDHCAPTLLVLPDGRYLAMYSGHGLDTLMRWRRSTRPGDITAWEPERSIDLGVSAWTTYTNTFVLPSEGNRIYNFYRSLSNNPFVMISDDDGESFTPVGRFLHWDRTPATGADPEKCTEVFNYTSPYPRYTSNGSDTIHFITTEDHPRSYDNSIYHGFVRSGAVHDSVGNVVDANLFDDQASSPVELSPVFVGDADNVAWTIDIELDDAEHPYIAFSVQKDGAATREETHAAGFDHRYYYGRFDGARWHVHEMAFAGSRLQAGEDDYTGLVALDPRDPHTVYISTNVDPATGEPLVSVADGKQHHELFRGTTGDRGASWAWSPLTIDSMVDNLRPIIPAWDEDHTAVIWLRGTYSNMRNYDLDVIGWLDGDGGSHAELPDSGR